MTNNFHPKATVHISRNFVICPEYFIGCIKSTDLETDTTFVSIKHLVNAGPSVSGSWLVLGLVFA